MRGIRTPSTLTEPTHAHRRLDRCVTGTRGAGPVTGPRGFSTFNAPPDGVWATVHFKQTATTVTGSATGGGPSNSEVGLPSARPELKTTSLWIETDGTTPLMLRAAKLKPGGATPLFNGKDLT